MNPTHVPTYRPAQFDPAPTQADSREPVRNNLVRTPPVQPAQFVLKRHLNGKTLKAWRKAHHLSAHALAVHLGITRSYVKSIEGGSLAASQKVIRRFDALRAEMDEQTGGLNLVHEEPPKPMTVVSRFKLPNTLEILSKPRRCTGCGKWFVPVTPNQRSHNTKTCRRQARRKARAGRRKKRS